MPGKLKYDPALNAKVKHGFSKSYQIHWDILRSIAKAKKDMTIRYAEPKVPEIVKSELRLLNDEKILNAYKGIGVRKTRNELDNDRFASLYSPEIRGCAVVEKSDEEKPVRNFQDELFFDSYLPVDLYPKLEVDVDVLTSSGMDKIEANDIVWRMKKPAKISNGRIYHAFHNLPSAIRNSALKLNGSKLVEAFDVQGADLHFICKIMENDRQFDPILHSAWHDELMMFEEAVKMDFRKGFGINKKNGKCFKRTKTAIKILLNYRYSWKLDENLDDLDKAVLKTKKTHDEDLLFRMIQRCLPKTSMVQSLCQFMRARFPRVFLWIGTHRDELWKKMNEVEMSVISNKMCAKLWEMGFDTISLHDAVYAREEDMPKLPDLQKLFYNCLDLQCDDEIEWKDKKKPESLDYFFNFGILDNIFNEQEDFKAEDVKIDVKCFRFLADGKTTKQLKSMQKAMNGLQTYYKWERTKLWDGKEIMDHLMGKTRLSLSLQMIDSEERFFACKLLHNYKNSSLKWEDTFRLRDFNPKVLKNVKYDSWLDTCRFAPQLFECLSGRLQLANENESKAAAINCPWEVY